MKCPYKHRLNAIPDACKDYNFHLELVGGQTQLRKTHYYFKVTGELAITEAAFCDLLLGPAMTFMWSIWTASCGVKC